LPRGLDVLLDHWVATARGAEGIRAEAANAEPASHGHPFDDAPADSDGRVVDKRQDADCRI
jgi:hypothetical protein